MIHIKNSIRGSVLLLQHSGVPVSLVTDFNEPIKNGSLCVDTTNQNLYILVNGTWTSFGTGFNSGNFIPLGGTLLNKPVFGNIEISDGIAFYSGQSSISFSDSQLILGFSDNDLNINDNLSLILNRNYVIQSNSSIVSIDSSSQHNYINKITTIISPGVIISNSSNNIINSNITQPFILNNVNNIQVSGNLNDLTQITNINNSIFNINTTNIFNFNNGNNININASIEQSSLFSGISNTYFHLRGKIYGNNSTYQNSNYNFIEGTFTNVTHNNSNFINYYGNISNTIFTGNNYIYNLGHITANSFALLTGSSSTSSIFTNNYGFYNLGIMGLVNINQSNNTVLLGKNTNINLFNNSNNTLLNNNGYKLSNNSNSNILFNNVNTYSTSYLQNSISNILFNNNEINSTSGNYNFIINTDKINLHGSNNLVFTPREFGSGFTGNIYGGNSVIFSLKPNKYYTIGSNVFTFGNINSSSGIYINSGNVLLGNISIDHTLTTNNQIFGAKTLQNINHSGQNNNIILNVDNFNVPASNTVYLPSIFYSMYLGNYGEFNTQLITSNRIWSYPDKSGTIALLSDIVSSSSGVSHTTSGNGLSFTGNSIGLGGTLSINTNLNTNNKTFLFKNSTNTIIDFGNRTLNSTSGKVVMDWKSGTLRGYYTPINSADLITLKYFNTHTSTSGSTFIGTKNGIKYDGSYGLGGSFTTISTVDGSGNYSTLLYNATNFELNQFNTSNIITSVLQAKNTMFYYIGVNSSATSGILLNNSNFIITQNNRQIINGMTLINNNHTTSLDWANGFLYSISNVLSVDWNSRKLYTSSNVLSIDWNAHLTKDSSNKVSIDWDNRLMYSNLNSFVPTIDWQNNYLVGNSSNYASVDWNNKILYTSTGHVSVDWANMLLTDPHFNNSLNWTNRFLYTSTGHVSIDWQNKLLNDNTTTTSIDYQNRVLYDSNLESSVNWSARGLYNQSGNLNLSWNISQLYDFSITTSMDWGVRTLNSTSGTVILDWNAPVTQFKTTSGVKIPTGTTLQRPSIKLTGTIRFNTDLKRGEIYDGNGWSSISKYSGSYSTSGTAVTTVIVPIGVTLPSSNYQVTISPTNALSAVLNYITSKLTTQFSVVFTTPLTGTVAFDWVVNI